MNIQVVRPEVKQITFEDVHFDFDRYSLRPEAVRALDEAVAVLLGLVAAERIGLGTPAAASAEAKISRVLPHALAERLEAEGYASYVEAAQPAGTGA